MIYESSRAGGVQKDYIIRVDAVFCIWSYVKLLVTASLSLSFHTTFPFFLSTILNKHHAFLDSYPDLASTSLFRVTRRSRICSVFSLQTLTVCDLSYKFVCHISYWNYPALLGDCLETCIGISFDWILLVVIRRHAT